MATTITNTNPYLATGTGGMAAGARATIYPGQIKRSFKVVKVEFFATTANDAFTITDNSSAANVLITGIAPTANSTVTYDFPQGVTWADWNVSALTTATDKLLIYVK